MQIGDNMWFKEMLEITSPFMMEEFMIDFNNYRMIEWDMNKGEDFDFAKKAILAILKEEKVSLSKIRCLFNSILRDIEDNNPINL